MIDQVTRGDRGTAMQEILNTLDGGDTKDMNVIAMFTTNHIELIEPTFLRGKRIGSIITMDYLDAATTRKFIDRTFAENYVVEEEGLDELCEYIETQNIAPAFMAEITETVKTNMVFEDSNDIKVEYLRLAVEDYLYQVGLSNTKDMSETPEKKFANAFTNLMFSSQPAEVFKNEILDGVENIYNS